METILTSQDYGKIPLIEDLSTSERARYIEIISNTVVNLITEADGVLNVDKAIAATAQRLNISSNQVHHGLGFGISEGLFTISADGSDFLI